MKDAKTLWAWVSEYPDGSVGSISAYVPKLKQHVPLLGRDEATVRKMKPIALSHKQKTGQRVWLRRWDNAIDVEEL